MGRLRLLAALVLAGLATPSLAALAPGDYVRTITFGGVVRDYRLHVPTGYDGSTDVPLVLNFHGLGSNAAQQEGISRIIPVADAAGFVVAHPNGIRNAFNAGNCCGNLDVDDVGFARAVVAAIAAEVRIDAHRIYATGLSNGGAMSQRLACDAADLFAAAAPMSFPLPYNVLTGCQPIRPISVMTVMGLTDVLVHYDGGGFRSAPDTFAYWHDIDGCSGSAPDDTVVHGQSRCETYTQCADGTQVRLCSIVAASFGGTPIDGHIAYLNPDFDLAQVAWDFMSQFTLPDTALPASAALHGRTMLRVGAPGPRLKGELRWTLKLAADTWTATDADGNAYTGSARRRGHGRAYDLVLTTEAQHVLSGVLEASLDAATSVSNWSLPVDPTSTLRLETRRDGTPRRLRGKLRILRGGVPAAVLGTYVVRAGS